MASVTETDKKASESESESPSNSQGSSTNPLPLSPSLPLKEDHPQAGVVVHQEEDTAMETGLSSQLPHLHDGFQDFNAEEILKYKNYEADYASRLKAKYFSNKDIYGGEIFEVTVTIGDETIKASRRSPTRSYADPKQSFVDQGNMSASRAKASPSVPNGYITPQKKTISKCSRVL